MFELNPDVIETIQTPAAFADFLDAMKQDLCATQHPPPILHSSPSCCISARFMSDRISVKRRTMNSTW